MPNKPIRIHELLMIIALKPYGAIQAIQSFGAPTLVLTLSKNETGGTRGRNLKTRRRQQQLQS